MRVGEKVTLRHFALVIRRKHEILAKSRRGTRVPWEALQAPKAILQIQPSAEIDGVCVSREKKRFGIQKVLEDLNAAIDNAQLFETSAHADQGCTGHAAEKHLNPAREIEIVHDLLDRSVVREAIEKNEAYRAESRPSLAW
jgi:hypothetical protein